MTDLVNNLDHIHNYLRQVNLSTTKEISRRLTPAMSIPVHIIQSLNMLHLLIKSHLKTALHKPPILTMTITSSTMRPEGLLRTLLKQRFYYNFRQHRNGEHLCRC